MYCLNTHIQAILQYFNLAMNNHHLQHIRPVSARLSFNTIFMLTYLRNDILETPSIFCALLSPRPVFRTANTTPVTEWRTMFSVFHP
jgi:hypothetical protein